MRKAEHFCPGGKRGPMLITKFLIRRAFPAEPFAPGIVATASLPSHRHPLLSYPRRLGRGLKSAPPSHVTSAHAGEAVEGALGRVGVASNPSIPPRS
ncbi:hypothetical protein KM043_002378 [Ampulex compressa]|nr:hypothetical protein KM043_002378 [Ampulex compressa]